MAHALFSFLFVKIAKFDPVSTANKLIFFALLKQMKENMQRPGTAGSVSFDLSSLLLRLDWQDIGIVLATQLPEDLGTSHVTQCKPLLSLQCKDYSYLGKLCQWGIL